MKKIIISLISMLMTLSFVFAVSMPLYANIEEYGTNSLGLEMDDIVNASSLTVVNDKGLHVVVDIEPNAVGKLTLAEVLDTANVIEELGQKITIHDIGYPESNMNMVMQDDLGQTAEINFKWPWEDEPEPEPEPTFTDLFVFVDYGVTKLAKDCFVTSVAKGQTITFTTEWSESYTLNLITEIDASLGVDIAELTASLGAETTYETTYTVSISMQFTGPPEDSEYNSREYRVKFYHRARSYKFYVDGEKYTGRFWEPMHYAQYSIDKTVN